MASAGVVVTAAGITKDLGLGAVACGSRRDVRQAAERRGRMKKRLGRIRTLVRQDRRCRSLVFTGAKPQGTWGHQGAGLAPSTILEIRRNFATAAMIRRPGGCTTTAFGLTLGFEADPAVSLRAELVQCWMEVARTSAVPRAALERVWGKLRELISGPRRWSRVRGPMAAVVATIVDLGWVPLKPDEWEDETGENWQLNLSSPGVVPLVLKKV